MRGKRGGEAEESGDQLQRLLQMQRAPAWGAKWAGFVGMRG